MKKTVSFVLALSMAASLLAGCGGTTANNDAAAGTENPVPASDSQMWGRFRPLPVCPDPASGLSHRQRSSASASDNRVHKSLRPKVPHPGEYSSPPLSYKHSDDHPIQDT